LKVLYSGIYHDDCHPFNQLCINTDTVRDADELKERDAALVIWGGADINPAYYNHPIHSTTHPGGARDRAEWTLIQRAIELGISIIGVCRGGQMLVAAAGGYLIQDVRGHHGRHEITTMDNQQFTVNSIHHQMFAGLEKVDHELVAWSTKPLSKGYYGYMDDKQFVPPEGWVEPEFVYFPKINGYAIQWHPEMMAGDAPATQYVLNYIQRKEDERNSRAKNFLSCSC
jgi:gamma-glutamyl-gamma-aminobutyrate hydrolase PuuD